MKKSALLIVFLLVMLLPAVAFAARWQYQITVGGTFNVGILNQFVNISARQWDDGSVTGQYEYSNDWVGESWRYHGNVACILVAGSRAIVVGPITISQRNNPPVGTWVAFILHDNGPDTLDTMSAWFTDAGQPCDFYSSLMGQATPFSGLQGNITIRTE